MNRFQILRGENPPPITAEELLASRPLVDLILSLIKGDLPNDEQVLLTKAIRAMTYDGDLNLNGLTTAESLVLPTSLGGYLNLNGLTTAESLVLPISLGGTLYLNGLSHTERMEIKQKGYRVYGM